MDREVYGFGDLAEIIRRRETLTDARGTESRPICPSEKTPLKKPTSWPRRWSLTTTPKCLKKAGFAAASLFNGIIAEEEERSFRSIK